jgi:hypothetical protein
MISIDLTSFLDSMKRIETGITRLGMFHVDGGMMMELQQAYDKRVFDECVGSVGQDIGVPPTPMYETGDLRASFMVTRDGLDMLEYGFELEGIESADDVENEDIIENLYRTTLENDLLVFGPIWDITDNEAEIIEEESARMFYKLYDGWL